MTALEPPPAYAVQLVEEVSAALERARGIPKKDVDARIEALDVFVELLDVLEPLREDCSTAAKQLVRELLRLKVDRRLLYRRPFSDTVVRHLAAEEGLPPERRGPRPGGARTRNSRTAHAA
jgi:hypothetical protein